MFVPVSRRGGQHGVTVLKYTDNPPARWPDGRALDQDLGDWWVARVRPRNEKVLAWELGARGVSYYLPMLQQTTLRKDNGKCRRSVVCLFSGYVPLVGYIDHRTEILQTGRIINVIAVRDQEGFVRELESVRIALGSSGTIKVHHRLVVGTRAKIVAGPMEGVTGVVLERTGRRTIWLNVRLFQRAIAVGVSPDHVALYEDEEREVGSRTLCSRT